MTTRKTKQPAVGDRGQRYEIWCDDEDGQPMQMGWSNNPESMKQAVEKHPCWKNHRAVDRLGAAAADNGAREPRSSAAPGSGALTWSAETPKRRGWWWFRAGPGCARVRSGAGGGAEHGQKRLLLTITAYRENLST